jgi:hypothetical protein
MLLRRPFVPFASALLPWIRFATAREVPKERAGLSPFDFQGKGIFSRFPL